MEYFFNVMTNHNFTYNFSIKFDNIIHERFPHCNHEIIGDYNKWELNNTKNVIYSYFITKNNSAT